MIRRARVIAWALAGVLLAAGPGRAGLPSPGNFDFPTHIALVGSSGGVIDPAGEFVIIARDLFNIPINNSLIIVDFANCSGLSLCAEGGPGLTVDCGTRTVRGLTGPDGVIRFRIRGHANTTCNDGPWSGPNCCRLYAEGIHFFDIGVAVYDLNGGGLQPSDLSSWLCDFFGGNAPSRSDYDFSGDLGPSDLSAWLDFFFANGSPENCPTDGTSQCPVIP